MPVSEQQIRSDILDLFGRDDYRPLKQHEIARQLRLKDSQRTLFRHVLYGLEHEGTIVCLRKNRWALPDTGRQISGTIRVNVQRFGFVTQETPGAADIFIPEENLGTSLDGDRVVVSISGSRPPGRGAGRKSEAQPIGKILRVLERHHPVVAGLMKKTAYYWYVIPDNPRLIHNIKVRDFSAALKHPVDDHKVVVKLDPWDKAHKPLTGVVVEDLGPADTAGIGIVSILRDHQIETDFSADLLHAAKSRSPAISEKDTRGRRDLRELIAFTIDPEDAKDFDDAVSLSRTADGDWQLGVHIADVAHFVVPGSPVDREAYRRGNSVYLVDRSIPMLPQHLTAEVCSLRPGVDRLTHTASLILDDRGRVKHSETYLSVIKSAARLTYDQVQAFFDGRPDPGIPAPVREHLGDMRALARILRARRMAEGSIDLSMPEIRCVLDAEGKPIRIFKRGSMEAYQLIEEFMLSANCVVARLLARKEVPAIYRVHEPPDDEQWARMEQDLHAIGISFIGGSRSLLNEIAGKAANTPMEYTVHLGILRNLKRAVYSSRLSEHFGLAFDHYTHFTSPIRRYPDLVVHRMLRAIEDSQPPPYSFEEASALAEHCSRTEQNADEAEDESVNLTRLEYFNERLRRGEIGPYPGIIVSLVPKGLIIELTDTLQRGLLSLASLHDDFYEMQADRGQVVGRRHRRTWKIGQQVRVNIARVDMARRRMDWELYSEEAESPALKPVAKKSRRSRRQRIR